MKKLVANKKFMGLNLLPLIIEACPTGAAGGFSWLSWH